MRLIDLKCSNCGAELKVNAELKQCVCNYCGKAMLVDDEVQKHEFINGYTYGYDLEKGKLQAQEDFRLEQEKRELERKKQEKIEEEKRIAEEARRKKEEQKNELIKWAKISGGVFFFGLLFCFSSSTAAFGALMIFTAVGLFGYKAYKIYFPDQQQYIGTDGYMVPILHFPRYWDSFEELNYKELYNDLIDVGFTNIRLVNLGDIKIGLFKKEESIEEITVAGVRIFKGGGKYPADSPIVIVYHGKR